MIYYRKTLFGSGPKLTADQKMSSTKSFKETVHLRIERDPTFRLALFQELLLAIWEGDITLGKTLLRDLQNHN